MLLQPLDQCIKTKLADLLSKLETSLNCDVMAIISPIVSGLERLVRDAIEHNANELRCGEKRCALAIVLDTDGGIVEVVERMVDTVRKHYRDVSFIIPDHAMSAGTIFAMSGDRILMDYFSCLGPIDPQIEKDGRLVPALSYLNQYNRLNEKAALGQLTTAEYALLSKLDLGELHQFEQARDLSIDLLKRWLSAYKFKNWTVTETRKQPVTPEMREKRAETIATQLSNNELWHSHGRGINMTTLRNELQLKIDDFSENDQLAPAIKEYFELLRDYMKRHSFGSFVHMRSYF